MLTQKQREKILRGKLGIVNIWCTGRGRGLSFRDHESMLLRLDDAEKVAVIDADDGCVDFDCRACGRTLAHIRWADLIRRKPVEQTL